MKYDPKDVLTFQEEVCNKTCTMKGKCIVNGQDKHWFLMCPHYFNWKIGYKSFVAEQKEYLESHPEEAEVKRKANQELAQKLKAQYKAKKKK